MPCTVFYAHTVWFIARIVYVMNRRRYFNQIIIIEFRNRKAVKESKPHYLKSSKRIESCKLLIANHSPITILPCIGVYRGDHTLEQGYKCYSENSLGDKEKNRNWLKKFEAKERHFHNGMVLQSLLGLNYGSECPNGTFKKIQFFKTNF